MEYIIGKQGNQPFQISDSYVSRRHMKLTVNGNVIEAEDLGSANGTFINGARIFKKTVTPDTEIQLGPNFRFRVSQVIPQTPSGGGQKPQLPISQKKEPPTYSIAHLEKVWNMYDQEVKELQKKNKNIQLMGRVPIVFSMVSGVIATAAKTVLSDMLGSADNLVAGLCFALAIIGVLVLFYSLYQAKSFDAQLEREKIDDYYLKIYCCPNKDCKNPFGYKRFSILKTQKGCPACRCQYKL